MTKSSVPPLAQALDKFNHVAVPVENGGPLRDGILIGGGIELRCMHGQAADLQRIFDRMNNELQSRLERTQVFEAAG